MRNIKTYSELIQISTYKERFEYLKVKGFIGDKTFGFNRYMNQAFYRSSEWKKVRNIVIARDLGCDMAFPGYEISGQILIHHINPITIEDIKNSTEYLLNPNYLVCVSKDTHNAIHYGDANLLFNVDNIERKPNDTCLWRR